MKCCYCRLATITARADSYSNSYRHWSSGCVCTESGVQHLGFLSSEWTTCWIFHNLAEEGCIWKSCLTKVCLVVWLWFSQSLNGGRPHVQCCGIMFPVSNECFHLYTVCLCTFVESKLFKNGCVSFDGLMSRQTIVCMRSSEVWSGKKRFLNVLEDVLAPDFTYSCS